MTYEMAEAPMLVTTVQILNMNSDMKVIGSTICKMDLEFASMKKETCTLELGKLVNGLERALSSLVKGIVTLEIGSMTR